MAKKKGAPKGPRMTKRIVILSNTSHFSPPKEKQNKKKDEDDDEDEGSEMSSLEPRNISFGSARARTLKSPAKRSKVTPGSGRGRARWPPGDSDDGEEDDDENEDDDGRSGDDNDERTEASGAGSHGELEIAINQMPNSMAGSLAEPVNVASQGSPHGSLQHPVP